MSMFRWAAVALLAGGCAGGISRPAFERFDPRVTPGASDYPDVPAVVLLDRGLLTFATDTERNVPYARLRRYRRVKILRKTGLPQAMVKVPYDPGTIVRGLIARAVQPDGDIDRASSGDQREIRDDDGRPTRVLQVPSVTVGTIIEYAYDVYMDDLRFIAPWAFQSHMPTVRSEYAVVVPEGFEVDLRFSTDGRFIERPPERFEIDGAVRYSWSLSQLPPRFTERDMPAADLLSPRAHVLFRRATVGDRAREGFGSWDDVAAWHLARFPGWTELSDETRTEARRVAGDASPDERALRLMEVLARDLSFIEPGAPLWRAEAQAPEAVLRAQRGNRMTRGMLLVALLRTVGVPAVPGLYAYSDQDVLLPDAPTVRALDGVAAVIPRPTGPLVLDPNQLTVSTEVPSPRLQGTRMVLTRLDGAEVIRVPRSDPRASKTEVEFALRMDTRGNVFGTLQTRCTGADAGELRRALQNSDPEDYAALVSKFLHRRGTAVPIQSVTIADLRALRRPLTVKGRVSMPNAIPHDGPTLFVRIGQLVGWPTSPLRQTRRSPLVLGAPRTVYVRGTLGLPEGYEVDVVPPAARHRSDGIDVGFEVRSETRRRLGFVRRERWSVSTIAPRQYPGHHRFVQTVRAAEEEAFSLRRPPERPLEY